MIGFFSFCLIVIWVVLVAKNQNDRIKKNIRKRVTVPQQESTSSSGENRALQSMRQGDKEAGAAPKQMPIEARRKRQQQAADRSRIHQNVHQRGGGAVAAQAASSVKVAPEIRFQDGELMAEVMEIMVTGYPTKNSNQRDFLAEGQALLDRYTLS